MRFLKFVLFLIIIAILAVGGMIYATQMGWDMSSVTSLLGNWHGAANQGRAGMDGHQMPGMGGPVPSPFNATASDNRANLNQALTSFNQAIDLITIDPYSQITMPNRMSDYPRDNTTGSTPGTTNKENVTININPPTTGTAPGTTTAPPGAPPARDLPPSVNIVFDQYKLEQVHDGIFKLSQAQMLLNELNNDLADQSMMGEANPPDQQTLVARYNLTLNNRNKLTLANRLLREAAVLVNINPYAPQSGYVFNNQRMQQLHQGITELAKSTVMLNRLNEEFNQQLMLIANDLRMAAYSMPATHGGSLFSWLGNSSLILNLAFLVIVLGIVLGVLILIKRLLRDLFSSPNNNHDGPKKLGKG
ncbi:MAG TPA: hypothetical protein PKA10_12415 [Selenomonadales bacterium]|nr:hypothetical protein [Selenomonadales bacterium]